MIIIGGDMKIKVEHRAEAIAAFVAMQQASQAEEGCITYVFSADLETEDTIHLFEIWKDAETLAAHGGEMSLAQVAAKLVEGRPELAEAASRLHPRIDVAWAPVPQAIPDNS